MIEKWRKDVRQGVEGDLKRKKKASKSYDREANSMWYTRALQS